MAPTDGFHSPANDDPWWTETSWYSFFVPERRLSGTLYTWFRPNLAVCASGVAVWDDKAEMPWEVLHYDYQWHLPIPDGDLTDITLASGLHIGCAEADRAYELDYRSPDLELALRFDAVAAPHAVPMDEIRFAGSAHFDQPGRVRGTLCLRDEDIEVDCVAIRDRSWGPRSDQGGGVRAGYCSGAVSERDAFHTISIWNDGKERIVAGYLVTDGELTDVVGGTREVERRGGRPERVRLAFEDATGRVVEVMGQCLNRLAFPTRPNNLSWMSLMRWQVDGVEAWGEDQDIWSPDLWREFATRAE